MKIEINNKVGCQIDLKLMEKVIKAFGQTYKLNHKELSLVFVSGAEIKKLNNIYRGLNQATDILSFNGEDDFLGELVICYSQIKRQAGKFNNSAEQELIFILVHGLLHLIGYDDKAEAERLVMIKMGEKFIKNYL